MKSDAWYVCRVSMAKPTALQKVLTVMRDGETRTISRLYFLSDVNPSTLRRMVQNGDLVKVGEAPNPTPPARKGQALVRLGLRHAA